MPVPGHYGIIRQFTNGSEEHTMLLEDLKLQLDDLKSRIEILRRHL